MCLNTNFSNNRDIISFVICSAGYIGVVSMLIVSLQNSSIIIDNGEYDRIDGLIESLTVYVFSGFNM